MKSSSWCAVLATAVGVIWLGVPNDGSASAETLRIQGSSGFSDEVIEPYQDRIEAATGHKLTIVENRGDVALLAVLRGEADLAMISAPLEGIVAYLQKSRPDLPYHLLRAFPVATSRVAYSVHPDNPVRSVSLAKLKQLLTGQIGNWRELGGSDLPIHVVSLVVTGGPKHATEEALLAGQHITPRSEILVENAEKLVQTVARDRGAVGFGPAGLARLYKLPELQTRLLIVQSYSFVSRDEPTDAMRAVIAATRSLVYEEEP